MKSLTWFNLKSRLTTTGTSVEITNDNRGNVATYTNESVVAISDDLKTFELMQISAAAGTMTIIKRGLDNSITKTEVPGLKKERGPNTKFYITALASDFVASNTVNTWTAKQIFGDIDITGILSMGNVSDINVLGKSNPCAVVADQAARDALYPSPVSNDRVYREDLHGEEKYDSALGIWQFDGSSTPTPDATESTKGIVQLATLAEVLAGVNPTKVVTPATLAGKTTDSFQIISDYPLGEPITDITKSCVFKETAPTIVENLTNGDTLALLASGSNQYGYRVLSNNVSALTSVTKHSSVTATRCLLKSDTGNTTLATGTFVGNVATFSYPLSQGVYYRIECDNSGSNYSYRGDTTPTTTTGTNINMVGGSDGGSNTTYGYNITNIGTIGLATTAQNIGDVAGNTRVSKPDITTGIAGNAVKLALAKVGSPTAFLRVRIETDNAGSPSGTLVDPNATKDIDPATLTTSLADTTVTFPGSFTVADGAKVHTVVSAVGDVVNASNYYKIGYSTNDTSTRALAKRNTTRGTATSTIFPYISSTLFHNTVLSLTDSDFSYKVALYGVATALGAIGTYPKLTVFGASDNFTGMTEGGTQYLGPTPGGIQSTAGTNSFVVGKARNSTNLRVKDLIS